MEYVTFNDGVVIPRYYVATEKVGQAWSAGAAMMKAAQQK